MTADHLTKANASSKPVTLASITEELLENREFARTLNDSDAMNSANDLLMKLHGLNIGNGQDRSCATRPDSLCVTNSH